MEQDLYYSLRFNLNEDTENMGNLFSSIKFFAQLYNQLDELLVGALPLKMDFSRSLKDFGSHSFLFVFRNHIIYPGQIPLGYQPEFKNVERWMTESRNLFSQIFNKKNHPSVHEMKSILDQLGDSLDFEELISYRSIKFEDLEALILDFQNACKFLDSEKGVIIFE